jgi:putative transposase
MALPLGYKSEWRGGFTEKVDRWFASSKACSVCGLVNQELKLHHRFWTCQCGAQHDRDHNAAKNIECFETTAGTAESYAGGDCVSPVLALPTQAVVVEAGSPSA